MSGVWRLDYSELYIFYELWFWVIYYIINYDFEFYNNQSL